MPMITFKSQSNHNSGKNVSNLSVGYFKGINNLFFRFRFRRFRYLIMFSLCIFVISTIKYLS
jgi:hypothetical protein